MTCNIPFIQYFYLTSIKNQLSKLRLGIFVGYLFYTFLLFPVPFWAHTSTLIERVKDPRREITQYSLSDKQPSRLSTDIYTVAIISALVDKLIASFLAPDRAYPINRETEFTPYMIRFRFCLFYVISERFINVYMSIKF